MSRTADWMREKFVDPLEAEFFKTHGRWPDEAESEALWQQAFDLAEKHALIGKLILEDFRGA